MLTRSSQHMGPRCDSTEIEVLLNHLMQLTVRSFMTPVCIWGEHGIGKTALVKSYAEANGFAFKMLSPAEFEEMGDLTGLPFIEDGMTVFAPPSWIPKESGPGILLIDDFNRGDERLMRGMMPLIETGKMTTWELPKQWLIVLTANPDNGDYSVTPIDDALMTRMMHVEMEFSMASWMTWAERNKLDQRGIDFAQKHGQLFSNQRYRQSTPRTFTQLLNKMEGIDSSEESEPLLRVLMYAHLDEEVAKRFLNYVMGIELEEMTAKDILFAHDFEGDVLSKLIVLSEKTPFPSDVFAKICKGLSSSILDKKLKFDAMMIDNLRSFVMLEFLPGAQRFQLIKAMLISPHRKVKMMAKEKEVSGFLF